MCSFHAIRAPSHRSPSHRCLHRRHSHYGYCSPHPCSCGQPARTRKTDKAFKVINFDTCTCALSACSLSSRRGSASRSRSSCGGSACSRTRGRARRRPVDFGMPFLQGFVFHMVPVRVKSNYYSFYRLGSASETVRRCATAAPPPFLLYAGLAERFLAVLALDTLKCAAMSIRSHVHDLRPLFTPSSSSAPYSHRRTAGCVLFVTCYLLLPSWYHGLSDDQGTPSHATG